MPARSRTSPRCASSRTPRAGWRSSPAPTWRSVSRLRPDVPPAAVLTDIEGTTTAIAFVKDRLFPFAEAVLDEFLAARGTQGEVAAILDEVRNLAPGEAPAQALRGWMRADAKVT